MSRQVLVPLDGSDRGWDAFEFAVEQFPDATLTALHVIDPIEGGYAVGTGIPRSSEEWYESAREDAEDLFAEARERAGGVHVLTAVEVGRPASVILEHAGEEGVDHVVMGSHGRSGVTRILLGSVAETVVRRSSVPVTVVR